MHEKECCMFADFFSFLNKFNYLIINKNTILNMGEKQTSCSGTTSHTGQSNGNDHLTIPLY